MHIVGEGPILVMALFRLLDDIQWTSKPSRIDGHIKKVDPGHLNDQNRIRESQDMVFLRHVKLTENQSCTEYRGLLQLHYSVLLRSGVEFWSRAILLQE